MPLVLPHYYSIAMNSPQHCIQASRTYICTSEEDERIREADYSF